MIEKTFIFYQTKIRHLFGKIGAGFRNRYVFNYPSVRKCPQTAALMRAVWVGISFHFLKQVIT